jgi:uncharacterized phage protein (TIGR02218 family)
MTIQENENSAANSQPIELYEFKSTFKNYYYTSFALPVLFDGNVYEPLPIQRTNISINSSNGDSQDLQIYLPVKSDIVLDYGIQITPPVMDCTIYRIQEKLTPYESNYSIYWTGVISNVTIEGNTATLVTPSVLGNALQGSIPSVYYQNPCNHVLFDSRCKVSRAANQEETQIVAINGNVITVADTGGRPAGFFKGGEMYNLIANERRMIIGQSGNDITINFAFGIGKIGDDVQITAGCDHAFSGDCKLRFNNQVNFGGFPFIPSKNPFTEGL